MRMPSAAIRKTAYAAVAGLLVILPLISGCGGGATAEHGAESPEATAKKEEMMKKYQQQYQQHPIPSDPRAMRGGMRPMGPGGMSGAPR